ncbi:MAG: helix-turn-helix domain-containing protein [Tepidisphaeraceae bacterium]
MQTQVPNTWQPGMDLPYVVSFGNGAMLAISLRAAWLKADPSGKPLLLPPAVRALDRLRAVFADREKITPGFIVRLREAIGLTQEQFARRLGVTKMTVSRWECGTIRPSPAMAEAIGRLQSKARKEGVMIDASAQGKAKKSA